MAADPSDAAADEASGADAVAAKRPGDLRSEVTDVPDRHRYEITYDGQPAGFAVYHRRGGRAFLVHTEIDPSFEGHGLGSALVGGLLDAERGRGEPVVPLCPFVRSYIDRHPVYADLVDQDMLARIDGS